MLVLFNKTSNFTIRIIRRSRHSRLIRQDGIGQAVGYWKLDQFMADKNMKKNFLSGQIPMGALL